MGRLGLLLLVVVVGAVTRAAAQCIQVGNQCLFFVDFALDTRNDAQALCYGLGGKLATITSATQMKYIMDYISVQGYRGTSFWVDGYMDNAEGDFISSDGELLPMGTPFWAAYTTSHEPSGDGDCVCLNAYEGFYMDDFPCSDLLFSICEFQMDDKRVDNDSQCLCPEPSECVGDLCLLVVDHEDTSWEGAEGVCKLLGGDLAIIDNIEQLREIYLTLDEFGLHNESFWVAGSDIVGEGNWRWLDGSSVPQGAPFWGLAQGSTLEPVTDGSKNCLGLQSPGEHYLRPADCQALQYPLCTFPRLSG